MNGLMLDLETLSLKSNAVIVSISAVQFDVTTGETGHKFEMFVDILPQMLQGADVSPSTLKWWSEQDSEAKASLISNKTVAPELALENFNEWVKSLFDDLNNVQLWGNGVTADNVWIRNMYDRHGVAFCLPYWSDTDVRTLVQLEGNYDLIKKNVGDFEGIKHNGIDDCLHQIKMCHEAYKLLKG